MLYDLWCSLTPIPQVLPKEKIEQTNASFLLLFQTPKMNFFIAFKDKQFEGELFLRLACHWQTKTAFAPLSDLQYLCSKPEAVA